MRRLTVFPKFDDHFWEELTPALREIASEAGINSETAERAIFDLKNRIARMEGEAPVPVIIPPESEEVASAIIEKMEDGLHNVTAQFITTMFEMAVEIDFLRALADHEH